MKKQPPNKKRTALKRAPLEQPRKKKPSEVEQPNRPLLKRVIFGEEKPDLTELEAGSTTILDILSPTTVDTKSRDYIVVDGVYHAYLYVTGYGYSTTVGSCWLAPLVEAGEGINMSFLSLNGVSTKEERENLMTMGFIKTHERSGTLLLTNKGRAFVELLLNGVIPGLRISYHDAAIERRLRLSELVLTAYYAGVDVFTTSVGGDGERPSLLITSITRNHGHNPWGSARVGAIAHLGGIYYAAHYVCPGIGRMAVNDELSALHNHTNFGKDTRRAFLFAGPTYGCILEELKARGKKSEGKLIRYSEAYRELHYPIHLLSCDETGARQLQIMAVPDYREKLARLMLRSAYQPPPEDAPAWDALYNGHPFVIGADMELRRIDAAIRIARERNCLPIALAALDAQGSAVLLARYADPGYATVYKVTDGVLTKLFGHAPALYEPPCTQFLTKKGDVVNAPLIKALGKDRGPRCK